MSSAPAGDVPPRTRLVVAAARGLIAIVGLAQVRILEDDADDPYEAGPDYTAADLATITSEHYGATQELFGLAVSLRAVAPDVVVVIAGDVPLAPADLIGLGRVRSVERTTSVPTVTAAQRADIEAATVASGEGLRGPYLLAVPDSGPAPQRLVAFVADGITVLADERLLP